MKKFSIEEIQNYLATQDSLGDILYNLSEEAIEEANNPQCITEDCENKTSPNDALCSTCWEKLNA